MKKTYMGYSITIPGSDRELLAYKKSMKYIILTKIISKMECSDSSLAYLILSPDGLLGMKNWGWEVSFSKYLLAHGVLWILL